MQSGKGIESTDDSENDADGGFNDDLDTPYDSDLDSIFSKSETKTHARKMRKWKTLANGRFEKMLLDCIVNTGQDRNKDSADS